MKNRLLRAVSLILAVLALTLALCSCGGSSGGDAVTLSFKQAAGYDYLKKLNKSTVSINGYMAVGVTITYQSNGCVKYGF